MMLICYIYQLICSKYYNFYSFHTGSQTSLQSWASSLSYDSQAEDVNEPKEFMRKFVEEVFKTPYIIDVDRKARFGELAQVRMLSKESK